LPYEANSRGYLFAVELPVDVDDVSSPLPVYTQNSAGDDDIGNVIPAGNSLYINVASSAGEGPDDVARTGGRGVTDGH
jgi:hypothetical protein